MNARMRTSLPVPLAFAAASFVTDHLALGLGIAALAFVIDLANYYDFVSPAWAKKEKQ